MKFKILFIALLVSGLSWGQTTLAKYQFENNLNVDTGAIGSPTITYTIASPPYNGGVSGLALATGTATSANSAIVQVTISTTGYTGITVGWSARTSNTTTPVGSWVLTGNSGSGFGGAIGTIATLSTSFATTGDISLGAPFDNNSSIVLRITSNNPSLRNLRIDDLEIKGTLATACTTPTTQSSSLTSSNVTTTGATLSWTDGATAGGSLVSLKLQTSTLTAPGAVNYTPTLNFATAAGANLINATNVVVAKNAAETVIGITGLSPGTQYTATPYAYNGSGTNVCFNATNPESFDFWTLALEPTASPASLTCGPAPSTFTNISLTYPAASSITNAMGYVLLYREGAAPTGMPVDGTLYTIGDTIGDATFGGYVSGTTATVSNLNGGTTYYFALIPFGSYLSVVQTINYKTTSPRITNCSTTAAPEINVRGIIASNPTITSGDITPSPLDNTLYGTVAVGGNQVKNFRIENTGNATLTISSIGMVGGNTGDFVATGPGPTFTPISVPFTIAAGTNFNFAITFSPTAAGIRNTTVTIGNSDLNENPYIFLVQGTGTATPIVEINVKGNGQSIPDNSIYPQGTNWTAFPVTLQGNTSSRVFTIENLGTTVLSLLGSSPYITITGAHASLFTVPVVGIPSNSIAGSGTTTFQIDFTPTSGGAKNATVTIYNNDTDEAVYNFNISGTCQGVNNIYVSGNGNDVPKGSVTTSTTNLTDFGLIAVTSGVQQNTFVITNLAGAVRYLSNVSLSGADAAMFSIISQPNNGAIISGNTTSFTVNFTPTSSGVKTADITFNVYTNSGRTTLDAKDGTFTYKISGEGIIYTACSINPVQTIAIQDFEATPATPTWNYNATPLVTDGVATVTGGTYNNGSGSVNGFIGARSFQFKGMTGKTDTQSAVLTMNPVDVSQYNNINFSMRVGAFRVSGTTQGLDVFDLVQVETSIDGGVNWSAEAVLKGYDNSRWSFATTGAFNAYYTGNNTGITLDTRNGNAELTGTAGISTFYVKNLPQSTALLIRITLNVDRDSELWALDNIKIEGQTPQSTTWLGSSWSAGFPTSSTKAIIDTGTTYLTTAAPNHGSIEACELQIKSGATVTVDSNYYFEIQSNIKNDGILNVENNGSLVQVNDAAVNTGEITSRRTSTPYERYDYTYWSSPVNTTTPISTLFSGWRTDYAFEFKTANFYDVKTINSAGLVTAVTADSFDDIAPWAWDRYTGAMTKGKGYAIMAPTSGTFSPSAPGVTVNFKGIPNNGVITLPLVLTANTDPGYIGVNNPNDDYNLVGNPYPSALFANKFITDNGTNTSGTLYFWTHVLNISASNPGPNILNFISDDYALYNMSGGTRASLTTPASSIPTGYIGSGQAFFVEAQSTNDLKFNNSMRRKSYANTEFFRTSSDAFDKDRVWLNLQNSDGMFGQLLIAYFDETTLDFDWAYDGRVNLSNNYVSFYSISGDEKYKIQARPTFNTSDIVPLGYFSAVTGEFTISIDNKEGALNDASTPIYLEDKLLNVTHNLKLSPYTFQTATGRFENRFLLRYTEALGSTTFENLENSVVASTNHGQLTINSRIETIQEVTVYDVLGRQLLESNNISNNTFVASNISMSQQALIVKIKLVNGLVVTRKVIL